MNSEEYKKYNKIQKEKKKSLKSGKDVMHLSYYDGIFDNNDISNIEAKLSKVKLRLSSYNKAGDINALLDDYSLDVFFILSQITINEIITGTITNLTWETLKNIFMHYWHKSKDKVLTKMTSATQSKRRVKFGFKANIDKNTGFNFHLDGDFSDKTLLEVLDKSFEFLKIQNKNPEYKMSDFVKYDEKNKKWIAIDVLEDIRKRNKKKNKRDT